MEKLSHFCQLAILIAILSIVSLATYAQDTTQKHIVDRGETIESIAQQYGTTVEELVKLNPDASQFIYVGMELVVPQKDKEEPVNVNSENNHKYVEAENNHKTTFTHNDNNLEDLKIGVIGGYSINNYTGKDIKGTKNKGGFHIGLDIRYEINEYCFVEGIIGIATKGYKLDNFSTSGKGWSDEDPNYDYTDKITMSTTNIEVPLFLGVKVEGFFIKAGPYFSYAIDGKWKDDYKYVDYPDIHSAEWNEDTKEIKLGDMEGFNLYNSYSGR